jgi:hypothetical protein
MLILQHPYGDPVQIESIQKILDVALTGHIDSARLFQIDDCLRHCLHHSVVPAQDGSDLVVKSESYRLFQTLIIYHLHNRLT